MQRRQVLQTSAATLGAAVGLTGCLSSSSDDQQTRRPDTERPNDRSDLDETDAVETASDDPETTETPADPTAPPRESAVFAAVEVSEARLLVTFESNPVVESLAESGETTTAADATRTATNETATTTTTATANRTTTSGTATASETATTTSSLGSLGDSLAALLPVGVAAGRPGRGGGGRGGRSGGGRNGGSGSGGSGWGGSGGGVGGSGGSGRSGSGRSGGSKSGSGSGSSGSGGRKPSPGKRGSGESPARGRNGRHKWHGGSYAAWRGRHGHRVRDADARVVQCGVGYIGDPDATEEELPGAGPVEWTHRCDGDHDEMAVVPSDPGWYRVGARLRGTAEGRDFGWEAVDAKLVDGDDGWRIDAQWKVSPRL
ncbi:hypothetical protein M0R88_04825 [Halorussus gelatinilyticus]|uniref:Uncharacterized protein n=1 Tax=Halorussus gelatinilyticus TaxID=2937524 RepID=A0A8U0IKY8_9EURY|nr:hypothetical protein [Halorussus gelatinilyticus]UPW01428.1 hypothetical protein M0R88_04825 [Halorussus gelatinilyticus]